MKWLITGGAGFIGCNTADRLLSEGHKVILLDNLSRRGSARNLEWLNKEHGDFLFQQVDTRNYGALVDAISEAGQVDVVLHLAAQVAVTSSVTNPRIDFEVNTLGTFNLLEAVRSLEMNPVMLYSSTNKVYGGMDHTQVVKQGERYSYRDLLQGVSEAEPLDFHSPYGCSKGAADQYWRDYHRIYSLRTVVLRQSCIYGKHQFGVEDQGWLAWFVIAATFGRSITIYGDGCQVRDILFVGDLIDAYLKVVEKIDKAAGQVYNIGGGPMNTLSVWSEFGPLLSRILRRKIPVQYSGWRPGDQRVYISSIAKAAKDLDWVPHTDIETGVAILVDWVTHNQELFD